MSRAALRLLSSLFTCADGVSRQGDDDDRTKSWCSLNSREWSWAQSHSWTASEGPDPQPNTHKYPEFLRNHEVWYKAVHCFTLVNRWPSDFVSVKTKCVKDTMPSELC